MTKANASEAIIGLLRRIETTPSESIDLYRTGIQLIVEDKDYTETEILNGLLYLESLKLIEISNNSLKLIKPLTDADKLLQQAGSVILIAMPNQRTATRSPPWQDRQAHIDGNPQISQAADPSYGIAHAPFGLIV
ncbi:hypothetical protein [Pararhizobium sp.]|uniref:hypothetical protein n=1 Tax=Pararhizobium sp. TaxID=1977563 RepID=UPI003D12FF3C